MYSVLFLYHQPVFRISGQETTALALAFSIYELARHPECQKRLREELESFSSEPTYDDYSTHFPYLDSVMKETYVLYHILTLHPLKYVLRIRLYPGLAYMERVATREDVIPLRHVVRMTDGAERNELVVRPGQVCFATHRLSSVLTTQQTIVIPIYTIHHLDSIWGDADTFRPERWLAPLPVEAQAYSGWSNTLGFSDGPRSCVGIRLGMPSFPILTTEKLITHFDQLYSNTK